MFKATSPKKKLKRCQSTHTHTYTHRSESSGRAKEPTQAVYTDNPKRGPSPPEILSRGPGTSTSAAGAASGIQRSSLGSKSLQRGLRGLTGSQGAKNFLAGGIGLCLRQWRMLGIRHMFVHKCTCELGGNHQDPPRPLHWQAVFSSFLALPWQDPRVGFPWRCLVDAFVMDCWLASAWGACACPKVHFRILLDVSRWRRPYHRPPGCLKIGPPCTWLYGKLLSMWAGVGWSICSDTCQGIEAGGGELAYPIAADDLRLLALLRAALVQRSFGFFLVAYLVAGYFDLGILHFGAWACCYFLVIFMQGGILHWLLREDNRINAWCW